MDDLFASRAKIRIATALKEAGYDIENHLSPSALELIVLNAFEVAYRYMSAVESLVPNSISPEELQTSIYNSSVAYAIDYISSVYGSEIHDSILTANDSRLPTVKEFMIEIITKLEPQKFRPQSPAVTSLSGGNDSLPVSPTMEQAPKKNVEPKHYNPKAGFLSGMRKQKEKMESAASRGVDRIDE